MRMIERHSHFGGWRHRHKVGPLRSLLRRLQMPPVIAFNPLGFIVCEQSRKDIITELLEVERDGLHRDGWNHEGFHRSIEHLGCLQGRLMIASLCFLQLLRGEGPNKLTLEEAGLWIDEIGKCIAHMGGHGLSGQRLRQTFSELVGP
jgi:hypothetical protein